MNHRAIISLIVFSIIVLISLAGSVQAQGAGGGSAETVTVRNYSFTPRDLTVSPGTTVTWMNEGPGPHTVTSDDGVFDSGRLNRGESFSYTFNTPGSYPYQCNLHRIMRGTVNVTSPAAPPVSRQISVQPSQTAQVQQSVVQYSEFYTVSPSPEATGEMGSKEADITGMEPERLYLGGLQGPQVSYSEYTSLATVAPKNSLWIQGADTWARYAAVPRGSNLNLIATTGSQGYGTVYEIHPSGRLIRNQLYFYPYSYIGFHADVIGEHVLLFMKDDAPSNVIVIDVVSAGQPQGQGRSTVNIVSETITGYDVYVDGRYRLTEGQDGATDGRSRFTVSGNAEHEINIRGAGFSYTYSRYFQAEGSYTIRIGGESQA